MPGKEVETEKIFLLEGKHLLLRPMDEKDANEKYLGWMNDPEVTRYLTPRFIPWALEDLRAYIRGFDQKKNGFLFAIIDRPTHRHIGNITIHQINSVNQIGTLGILIGEKESWGKGVMFEACQLVIQFAFETLGLHKIKGGAVLENAMSIVTLKKMGFQIEGKLREEHCWKGKRMDTLVMGLLRKDYAGLQPPRNS